MDLNNADVQQRIARFLATQRGGDTPRIEQVTKLSGGTLQENWRLDLQWPGDAQRHAVVVRTAGASGIGGSATRAQEYAVLQRVAAAGVCVATPRGLCTDAQVAGSEFFVTDFVDGTAVPQHIVRDAAAGGWGASLAFRLGQELARLHRVQADASLDFLPPPNDGTALGLVAQYRRYLDTLDNAHPTLEWVLRWLEANAPAPDPTVLCHGDFRTGNYLVHQGALSAILDWELAHWGQPLADMGWLCTRFWRFGARDKTAGGLADRSHLFDGYENAGGTRPQRDAAHYWEVMANARWAIISLQQAQRHLSGREPSLELALIGRQTCEMELEALDLIERGCN
ncbi:phosphotransferase family protein [Hydrogenophaga sp.]|uniref:phosphotransferase family protein n=1 Tax=Hydrogenophaga sp. TaxID=1904254 RepID=UPI00271A6DA8|nr:phosphotransferase family protein [Hydrogenophaga sp.]MDO9435758.1 phosphotransferase family protein [Hydrogenophaga sp.]